MTVVNNKKAFGEMHTHACCWEISPVSLVIATNVLYLQPVNPQESSRTDQKPVGPASLRADRLVQELLIQTEQIGSDISTVFDFKNQQVLRQFYIIRRDSQITLMPGKTNIENV